MPTKSTGSGPKPRTGFGFDAKSKSAQRWAAKFAGDRVRKVTDETKLAVRQAITASIAKGIPPRDAAKQIRQIVGMNRPQTIAWEHHQANLSPNLSAANKTKAGDRLRKKYIRRRAMTIARTEVIDSLSAGAEAAWGQAQKKNLLGTNAKKRWITVQIGACAICADLNGQERELGGAFESLLIPKGLAQPILRPTAHPNCRCGLVPVPGVGGIPALKTGPDPLTGPAWMDSLLANKVGEAKGSNVGGVFVDSKGVKYYVKEYSNPTQAQTEAIANTLYRELGKDVPESFVRTGSDGKTYFVSKWIDGMKGTLQDLGMTADDAVKILDGFVADVFTANWDAVGTGLDNVVRLASGKIVRIDQGGSLLFRAKGVLKPASVLNEITEWDNFIKTNPYYRQVFQKAGVERADDLGNKVIAQIDELIAVDKKYGSWAEFVKKTHPEVPPEVRAKVAQMLEARYKLLIKKRTELLAAQKQKVLNAAQNSETTTLVLSERDADIWKRFQAGEKPKDIAAALNLNVNNVRRVIRKIKAVDKPPIAADVDSGFTFPAENVIRKDDPARVSRLSRRYRDYVTKVAGSDLEVESAVRSYTATGHTGMNRGLRLKNAAGESTPRWSAASRRVQKFLVEAPKPPDDLVVWRGVDGWPFKDGDVVDLTGFQSTSVNPSTRFYKRYTLEIHPNCGAYINKISQYKDREYEFLIPHGQKWKILGRKRVSLAGKITEVIQLVPRSGCPKIP